MISTNRHSVLRRLALAAVLFMALASSAAHACPNCKNGLAVQPNGRNLERGYQASILFMLAMPFVVGGGLSAYFYYEVRKARAKLEASQAKAGETPTHRP